MDQIVGLGQSPQDPVAQLTSALASLQDSIVGPVNGVKTTLDALSGVYNSTATPPPPGSEAALAAQLAGSSDMAIGPAVTPTLQALGQSISSIDGQAATAATNFTNAYQAANNLASNYQAVQTANQQLTQALQTLYAAAGYTDYTTPIGTVASAIGAWKTKAQQPAPAPAPAPAPVPTPGTTTTTITTPAPMFNTSTLIAGIAALAVVGGGIWWWYSSQQKKKQLPAMSQRRTLPSPAPAMGEPAAPVRRSFPMSSRPNATARALMPRSAQARGGKRS